MFQIQNLQYMDERIKKRNLSKILGQITMIEVILFVKEIKKIKKMVKENKLMENTFEYFSYETIMI